MFITNDFIYLRFPRAATLYTVSVLRKLFEGRQYRRYRDRHDGLWAIPKDWRHGKKVISTIRNPWEWYLSYWSMACKKKHFFSTRRSAPRITKGPVSELYKDKMDIKLFRLWLHWILVDCKPFEREFDTMPYRTNTGFYTYWFARVFNLNFWNLKTINYSAVADHCIDYWFYYPTLRTQLVAFFKLSKDQQKELDKYNTKPLQRAKRHVVKRKPLKEYYTQELIDLIKEKDRHVIKLFGYKTPELN